MKKVKSHVRLIINQPLNFRRPIITVQTDMVIFNNRLNVPEIKMT
jgi:hypothetical protein